MNGFHQATILRSHIKRHYQRNDKRVLKLLSAAALIVTLIFIFG